MPDTYVPLSIRQSQIVRRLWRFGWLRYRTARNLARLLP